MKTTMLVILAVLGAAMTAAAQEPLYIVNGVVQTSAPTVPPDEIEKIETLPADEQTIARYGPEAGNGVVLVTLRYDVPARFSACGELSFADYVAREVKWGEDEPPARVVLRYKVLADGAIRVDEVLEATEKRLLREVLKVLELAPRWEPASKEGRAVESEGVLRLQLPEGSHLPRERYVVVW